MKRRALALVMTGVMAATLFAGCDSKGSGESASSGSAGGSSETSAGAEKGPVYDKYSDMTADELYAAAKKEGGEINVYATSSKMLKVEEDFEKAFPGLNLVVSDMDNDEVVEKCKTENETGNVTGDVLQTKDSQGGNFYELLEDGYIENYYPKDICEHIDEKLLAYGYPLYVSQSFWYYNTDAFPDGSPVTNWWDIIEKDENGNQKYALYTKEIGQESTYLALFASFIQNSDEMEKAYKDKYDTDLEYTYDASSFDFDVPEENAGVEYLYRFSQMTMTFIGDGDELVQAVANSTKDAPALALASGGKIGNRDESGYAIAWVTGLEPYTGIENTEYLYTVGGCDNPAGARLFIYWVTGGADGESGGLAPFEKEGNWPVRDDVECDWNGDYKTVSECGAIAPDIEYVYETYYDVSDMWTYWLSKNPNMN
jgi:ABC-type glycerol-3-phosphate transport system substrate-binding protein